MFLDFENYVKTAIDRLGGPTKVSTIFGIATGTVHTWIKARRVSNIDYAKTLAQASGLDVQRLRPTK